MLFQRKVTQASERDLKYQVRLFSEKLRSEDILDMSGV